MQNYVGTLWASIGRPEAELKELIQNVAETAFLKKVKPSPRQISIWKAQASWKSELPAHVEHITGLVLIPESVEVLWHIYTKRRAHRNPKTAQAFKQQREGRWICESCGRKDGSFHVDHIVAVARGGLDDPQNFQLLCQECNLRKGKKTSHTRQLIQFEGQK